MRDLNQHTLKCHPFRNPQSFQGIPTLSCFCSSTSRPVAPRPSVNCRNSSRRPGRRSTFRSTMAKIDLIVSSPSSRPAMRLSMPFFQTLFTATFSPKYHCRVFGSFSEPPSYTETRRRLQWTTETRRQMVRNLPLYSPSRSTVQTPSMLAFYFDLRSVHPAWLSVTQDQIHGARNRGLKAQNWDRNRIRHVWT